MYIFRSMAIWSWLSVSYSCVVICPDKAGPSLQLLANYDVSLRHHLMDNSLTHAHLTVLSDNSLPILASYFCKRQYLGKVPKTPSQFWGIIL